MVKVGSRGIVLVLLVNIYIYIYICMKLSILLLTIFLISILPISGQPTPLDTTHRKVWLSGIGGVNSFLRSPIIGMTGEIEITDNKYPLIIHFNGSYSLVMSRQGQDIVMQTPNSILTSQLDFGRRFKKFDVVISPIGFMGYYPKTDFVPQMSLSFYYKGIKLSQSDNLQFRLTANYNYAINPGFGFNAVINYRFKQFKNL
jgi:hypothetical protein